jgi:hypothetical protein
MKIERRASLETGNVTAESVRNRPMPPSVWKRVVKAPRRSTGVWALAYGQRKGALTQEARGGGLRGRLHRKPPRDRAVALGGGEVRSSVEASNDRRAKGPWFRVRKEVRRVSDIDARSK